ncbi:flagellar motor protein MotB [Yoonia sediminilitoris]|uniref:Chemotaxis protein MotB n=1 Tax=Yoonia sediminilitoris TaxID=1286148 RepID=A0A2T6K9V2_9RHOB|nr:flagellar motor protein MotB [Yoonia sediminilitoris]PUB11554.1 chemotaxis protein MotB [Yoonia sediminilitoris]RCW91754.1 chemotaxis protein MotB [Yoonia sediminilitoris]
MANGSNGPTIIRRKKVSGGDGHHGGAWKVAYADFVTAMMAFFMLMWLLNATTEQQRKGIADYFSPTIPINRISGGGSGAFGGDNIFTEDNLSQSGTGINQPTIGQKPMRFESDEDANAAAAEVAALQDLEAILFAQGGESMISDLALRHVVSRLTDEGLVIEIFDLPNATLFEPDSATPSPVAAQIAGVLARLFQSVTNKVAIKGHLQARSVLALDNPIWELSTSRASQMRLLLEAGGLNPLRISRITGSGDRSPAVPDATAPRNNRIEVVLLRSNRP